MDHVTPSWIKGAPIYFITICASERGPNQLCHPGISKVIFAATKHYNEQLRWHAELLLLMPDHLHALICFPKIESMSRVISSWKHFLSLRHNIEWQRDYFDHRLRNDESHAEKAAYIRYNPVRAGLTKTPEEWPYVWASNW
jgi:putative transposase